jgi:hypothetical protein
MTTAARATAWQDAPEVCQGVVGVVADQATSELTLPKDSAWMARELVRLCLKCWR